MQLIQPYVQKSRMTMRPRRSASLSVRPPVPIQSSPLGNSGARTLGTSIDGMGLEWRLRAALDRAINLHASLCTIALATPSSTGFR